MQEFLSVSEYANITGKDPGNIRKQLINGTLNGEKIGNQWVISKDTEYPEDKRIKNGYYHNWRKKGVINKKYPKLLKSLSKMSSTIASLYGDKICSILLYGSYARNEENSESDIDIAVILNDDNDELIHDKMTDVIVDYELDLGVTLSVITIESHQYQEWNNTLPFYINIKKEGIPLWKNNQQNYQNIDMK